MALSYAPKTASYNSKAFYRDLRSIAVSTCHSIKILALQLNNCLHFSAAVDNIFPPIPCFLSIGWLVLKNESLWIFLSGLITTEEYYDSHPSWDRVVRWLIFQPVCLHLKFHAFKSVFHLLPSQVKSCTHLRNNEFSRFSRRDDRGAVKNNLVITETWADY